ncbi:MAG: DNA polymerase III subunit gamma/tau, partial [Kiritimatiellae bacterium]|nr:DNA polymerase III subunit gamma/tau [Kiritimatiellia bacterium]
MSYEVLARKWRPQRFGDVVGQEHVIGTLSRAIAAGRVAHAYLLVGPRGTGKTTTARILAKALNCPNRGPDGEPCGTCDSCREITAGTSLDVIEIDAASNNGVDEIRELRDNVRYAPTRGPYKIYIIDEVHMLSTGAFNALLKTLEEPPAHAKFFLATTDVHKVPNTILSRCQRFDLRRIGLKDIAGRLREIAEAEGWKVSEGALTAIARGAEGGLRDAESALDQIVSFRGTTIEEQDVLDVFGLVSWATVGKLAGAVLGNDARTILGILG